MNHARALTGHHRKQRTWGRYRVSIDDYVYTADGKMIFYKQGFFDRCRGKIARTVDRLVNEELNSIEYGKKA